MSPFSQLRDRINATCKLHERDPREVLLMAVTKTQPPEAVTAVTRDGAVLLGENRVQEGVAKRAALPHLAARWELIGPLQSNKARGAVEAFDRIQTLDRPKIIQAVARHAEELGKAPYPVLLQVNAGNDPAKAGVAVADAPALLEAALGATALQVEGLMTIAPLDDNPEVARRCFARLRETRDALAAQFDVALPVLSMGMSGDMDAAIAEGSTLLRVGSALFGPRTQGAWKPN